MWDIAGLYLVNPNFHLLRELGKLGNPSKSYQLQHLKIPQCLCELGKTWDYNLRSTLKNPNAESMDELGKVMS